MVQVQNYVVLMFSDMVRRAPVTCVSKPVSLCYLSMIKAPIEDIEIKEHIASLPADRREVFLLADESVRLSCVSATEMLNQMKANHRLGFLESYILGQGYIAGALLSSEVKGNDRIQLSVECGGPVKGMDIEAWACGAVRGYLRQNPIVLEKPLDSLDTNLLFGPGFLSITKLLEGSKTPFTGQIMMEYGSLAEDLALYYQQSEQTPSLFYISIHFDKQGRIWGAGGIFIQALPGCRDDVLARLQECASGLPKLGKAISEGMDVKDYILREFEGFTPKHLEHSPIGCSCPCSKKHYEKYLASLPESEKKDILNGDFPLRLECLNCGTEYEFTKSETETLFQEAK